MKRKFPSFIALVCILIYAGAVLFGAYRVYTGIQNRRALAVRELDGVHNFITQNASRFYTEPFRDRLRKTLADCTALQGIIITGSQGNLDFEKEAGAIIRRDPNPRFISKFGYASLDSIPLDIQGSRNVRMYSTYNAVDYGASIKVLKQTLFAILLAFLLSFLTMMITMLTSRAPAQREDTVLNDSAKNETIPGEPDVSGAELFADDDFFTIGDETERDAINNDDIDDLPDRFDDDVAAAEPEVPADETGDDMFDLPDFDGFTGADAAESNENDFDDDGFHLDDFVDEADFNLPLPETEEPAALETNDSSGAGGPNGLYSPRSNIGWEAYTRDRLSSELHICASSEQDLVVILAECGDGVNCDGTLYKKIADEAVALFNLKDLTFEYGERGITVIIPNTGLEQGISKAEAFHTKLFKTCPESFHAKSDFLAGISSRSGRLIEADRLMLEAARALDKAKIDASSPIIAFKSDPEKYREYLQKESS